MNRNAFFAALLWLPLVGLHAAQQLTHQETPYDLCKANWQAANYLQALISPRWKAVAFAQETFGDAEGVGGLYFLDDQGRVIRSLVEEAEFGPVARVDAVALMAQGLIEGSLPGARGRHFFTIEGRQSVYLEPRTNRFSAFWLQDSSEQFADLRVEIREGDSWRRVEPGPVSVPLIKTPREERYRCTNDLCRVEVRNLATVLDTPPCLEVTAPRAVDVRVTLSGFGARHHLWLGRRKVSAGDGKVDEECSAGYVLAHRDAKLDAAASSRRGWERPEIWDQFDSMLLLSWSPAPVRVIAQATNGVWTEVTLEWRQQTSVRACLMPFLELDPAECDYVFVAAEHAARDGHLGLKPWSPIRNSNNFMGALPGLAAAAWLLQEYGHPLAPQVKEAAVEAFDAVVRSERRGYHGTYGYNAISAAGYLRRVAPERFDYGRWVSLWAGRDLERRPPGASAPPWSDTAMRAIRGWREAGRITGDAVFREAADKGLAQFDLPAADVLDAIIWKGGALPWNGYDCNGASMLLGEWGCRRDPRAQTFIERAAAKSVCDFGYAPLVTWTCDDLLPYYVGYSLPAVFPDGSLTGPKRRVKLDEFVAYDRSGKVWAVQRPPFPPAP